MTKEYFIYKVTDGNSEKSYQIWVKWYFLRIFYIGFWHRNFWGIVSRTELDNIKADVKDLRYQDNSRKKRYELVQNAHLIFEEDEG